MEETNTAVEIGRALGGLLSCFLMIAFPVLFIFSLIMAIVRKSKVWTITAITVGVLGLVVIGGIVALGVKEAVKTVESAKLPSEFVSNDGLVMVTADGRWTTLDTGSADASLQIGDLAAQEFLLVVSEAKSDFEEGMEVGGFADLVAENIAAGLGDPESTKMVALTINGCPARQYEVSGTMDGLTITYLNTFVEGEAHFHQVLTWTLEEMKGKAFPELRKVVGSFREVGSMEEGEPAH